MTKARKLASIVRDEKAVMAPLRVPLRRVMDEFRSRIVESVREGNCQDFKDIFEEKLLELLNAGTEIAFLKGGRRAELSSEKMIDEPEKETFPTRFSLEDEGSARARGISEYLQRVSGLDPSDFNRVFYKNNREMLKNLSDSAYSILRKKINELILQGTHASGGLEAIREVLEQSGLNTLADSQIATIFRTQSMQAYNAGRWNVVNDRSVGKFIWGFEYVTAMDNRVRDEHRLLHGVRLPKDDPFWRKFFPPNGWNCRCTAIEIWDDEDDATIDFGITGRDPRRRNPEVFNVPEVFRSNPGMATTSPKE